MHPRWCRISSINSIIMVINHVSESWVPIPHGSTPPGRVPLPWHGTDGTDGALATTQVTWKEMLGTRKNPIDPMDSEVCF